MYSQFTYLYSEPLKNYSTIRIGGAAKRLAVVTNENDLLNHLDSSTVVIGKGSNILFSDNGFDGTVLVLKNSYIKESKSFLEVGAGTQTQELCRYCYNSELGGAEWLFGIPSSIGGAVYMNAGAHGSSMQDIVSSVRVLKDNVITEYTLAECCFGYRTSVFKQSGGIILSAKLLLPTREKSQIHDGMMHFLQTRRHSQPTGLSLGSVFKNPDKAAGYYIDQAGLKGKSVGDLYISQMHANFIINRGNGTATDFLKLTELIKNQVYNRFKIELTEEFIKIGDF